MSSAPVQPLNLTRPVPTRHIASMGIRLHGHYRKIKPVQTVPAYVSLRTVMQILADINDSPASWSAAKLRNMTARNANWKALGSAAPNHIAMDSARRVLMAAHTLRPLEPSYVTASADGGVGIVYKSAQMYAALECLNTGGLGLLWFDKNGEPQSRKVRTTDRGIKKALEQIAALRAHA